MDGSSAFTTAATEWIDARSQHHAVVHGIFDSDRLLQGSAAFGELRNVHRRKSGLFMVNQGAVPFHQELPFSFDNPADMYMKQ